MLPTFTIAETCALACQVASADSETSVALIWTDAELSAGLLSTLGLVATDAGDLEVLLGVGHDRHGD